LLLSEKTLQPDIDSDLKVGEFKRVALR